MTDAADDDPEMPDALEVAAAAGPQVRRNRQARRSAARRRDGRQRPVRHVRHAQHFGCRRALRERPAARRRDVRRPLRAAGAIIIAKSNLGEYASGIPRSSFGGTFCNPYDTERSPMRLELGIGLGGRGESRDVRHRRGNRLVDPRTRAGRERRGHRADRGAREPRRHDSGGHQYARRADLPQRRGRRRVLQVIAGYDPKDELTVFSHGPHAREAVRDFRAPDAARRHANRRRTRVHGQGLFTTMDEQTIDIVEPRGRGHEGDRRRDRRPRPRRCAVRRLLAPIQPADAQRGLHAPVSGSLPGRQEPASRQPTTSRHWWPWPRIRRSCRARCRCATSARRRRRAKAAT